MNLASLGAKCAIRSDVERKWQFILPHKLLTISIIQIIMNELSTKIKRFIERRMRASNASILQRRIHIYSWVETALIMFVLILTLMLIRAMIG